MKAASMPLRLRLGLALLGGICLFAAFGPLVLGPAPTADAVHSPLLPPGASVTTVELVDGSRLAAAQITRTPSSLILRGGRSTTEVAVAEVAATHRRRAWLGTDRHGRDVLHLMARGGRISLAIAGLGALVALFLGTTVGLLSAGGGRVIDQLLMRGVDGLLAFPSLLLLILAASVLQPGPGPLIAILGLTSWMGLARLVRGQVLSVRERPFVLAARVAGTPWYRVWGWHFLPEIRGPVAQDTALRLGDLVLAEATLSYLGLGLPPTTPTWGHLVNEGHRVLLDGWWLSTIPGLAIALLVISLALIGDGLQGE